MPSLQLGEQEIREIYQMIQTHHQAKLAHLGVKLPRLEVSGKFTKDALALVYLAKGYPQTVWVTKEELTQFVRRYYPNTNDVQSARHLGMQSGFYIVSSRRGNYIPKNNPPPSSSAYLLVTLDEPHPAFLPDRRLGSNDAFEAIKQKYDNRCATCGSREGEPNLRYRNQRTQLQRAHRNPKLPLTEENTIPQCQFCNRADRNYWVYDERGRVVGVASVKPIQRSIEKGYLSEQEVQSLYEYLSKRQQRGRRRRASKRAQ
ncbi:MAG: hypothetical protein WHS44_07325 [Fimbriimonadales bacterium]|nr:MAG: hypothetical protein KatS3mg018_1296 [Fimbriimonadales bacterium]